MQHAKDKKPGAHPFATETSWREPEQTDGDHENSANL
jgi:hypothetical protein